jgi:hypothetical protein
LILRIGQGAWECGEGNGMCDGFIHGGPQMPGQRGWPRAGSRREQYPVRPCVCYCRTHRVYLESEGLGGQANSGKGVARCLRPGWRRRRGSKWENFWWGWHVESLGSPRIHIFLLSEKTWQVWILLLYLSVPVGENWESQVPGKATEVAPFPPAQSYSHSPDT